MTVEEDLLRLQNALRNARPVFGNDEAVEGLRVTNPTTGESELIAVRHSEWRLGQKARAALIDDVRFEYLKKPEDQIAEFVAACVFQPREKNIEAFVASHAREPEARICYLPIENLKVATPLEVLGLTLLPTDDASLPPADMLFSLSAPVGSVARVTTVGTNTTSMEKRAREEVEHALRLMRIAFRAERGLNERQLRFRVAESYAFDAGDPPRVEL